MSICPHCRKEVVFKRDGRNSYYGRYFHLICLMRYLAKYEPHIIRGEN